VAVTLTSRSADGQIVSVPFSPNGDAPTEDAGASASATGAQGAPSSGPASPETPTGSPPATPQTPAEPGRPPAGSAADAGVADADDDEPEPEVATVDYVARRIKRLTAKQRAQERAHAEREQSWTQERAHLQGQLETMQRLLSGATPELPQTPPGPPQAEQYASHEDYVRALARFEAQDVARTQQQQTAQQQQAQAMQQALMEREAAFKQAHPDFDDVVRRGLVGKVAPHVQQALMVLPEGPQLAYLLAQQPDTVTRLNTLPPVQVVAELGRLSAPATNGTAAPPVTPTPTNGTAPPPSPPQVLPPPPTPLSGMGQGAPSGATPDMSQAEFRRMWNAGWRPSARDFGRQ